HTRRGRGCPGGSNPRTAGGAGAPDGSNRRGSGRRGSGVTGARRAAPAGAGLTALARVEIFSIFPVHLRAEFTIALVAGESVRLPLCLALSLCYPSGSLTPDRAHDVRGRPTPVPDCRHDNRRLAHTCPPVRPCSCRGDSGPG